jgi:hypothetical protein
MRVRTVSPRGDDALRSAPGAEEHRQSDGRERERRRNAHPRRRDGTALAPVAVQNQRVDAEVDAAEVLEERREADQAG